jgi:hypothetical protein
MTSRESKPMLPELAGMLLYQASGVDRLTIGCDPLRRMFSRFLGCCLTDTGGAWPINEDQAQNADGLSEEGADSETETIRFTGTITISGGTTTCTDESGEIVFVRYETAAAIPE